MDGGHRFVLGRQVIRPLTIAAAIAITSSGLGGAQPWIALVIFIIIASLTVIIPVITYLLAGEKAERVLNRWKTWLIANNVAVMAVLFLVFGVVLIGNVSWSPIPSTATL